MPPVALPDPPPSDGVVALRGFEPGVRLELRANAASQAVARRAGFAPIDAPLIRRRECDGLPDVFFARLRGG